MDFSSLLTKSRIQLYREQGKYRELWKLSSDLTMTMMSKYRGAKKMDLSDLDHHPLLLVELNGHCGKNFEPVKNHLKQMLLSGEEENIQLCVFVDNECVIDLYGTAIGKQSQTKICRSSNFIKTLAKSIASDSSTRPA